MENFSNKLSEAVEHLQIIEKKLLKTKLPDGGTRSPQQVADAATVLLGIIYNNHLQGSIADDIYSIKDTLHSMYMQS